MNSKIADTETAPLMAPRLAALGEPDELPAGFWPLRLTVASTGATVELNRPETVVGRHTRCDLRLPMPDVSRNHCRFMFQNGTWWIEDRASLNGVHVNEECVTSRQLHSGDRVRIGGVTFIVQSAVEHCGDQIVLRSIAEALAPASELRRAS